MNKFLIMPDSFKGTLSAKAAADAMESAVLRVKPDAIVRKIPVADGGEGTVDAYHAVFGGSIVTKTVTGPLHTPVKASYLITPQQTAVIEMAAAAGITLLHKEQLNPCKTTTYGVGELIADAVERGCKSIILGLGGSCTNDFGCGAAAACGVRFYDADGNAFTPTGDSLSGIQSYDTTDAQKLLSDVTITAICDVNCTLYGKNGAAYVFAPQKGASPAEVELLDDNLRDMADLVFRTSGVPIDTVKSAGAAGGMGGGMAALLGASLLPGIDTLLNALDFDAIAGDYDCIFTGEGKFDSQSLAGKVCIGIAEKAKAHGVPVIVIAGGVEDPTDAAYEKGVTAAFSINRLPQDLSVSAPKTKENLIAATENIMRVLLLSHR